MLIYDRTALQNLKTRRAAHTWLDSGVISAAQFKAIEDQHPADFYTPAPLIQITLFAAASIAVSTGWGFLALFAMSEVAGMALLMLLYGAGIHMFLESVIVRQKKFLRAGVDDALIFASAGLVLGGLLLLITRTFGQPPVSIGFLISLPFLAWLAIRFAHPVMAAFAFASAMGFVFSFLLEVGPWGKSVLPFLVMVVSVPFFLWADDGLKTLQLEPWWPNLEVIKALSLVSFYVAGNYWVVRELSQNLLGFRLAPGEDIPLAPLFYALTALVPMACIAWALRSRDRVLLRAGLLFVALSVLTFKIYFSFAPPEVALTIAGAVLIMVAVGVIKYLRNPVGGYTHENLLKRSSGSLDAEALLVAETMASTPGQQPGDGGIKLGGGASGGAGAEGEY